MARLGRPEPVDLEGRNRRRAATRIRHEAMRVAVRTLRKRIGWTQGKLAASVDKHLGQDRTTRQSTISKWETGIDAPSPRHRMALTRISAKYKHNDLAAVFRRPAAGDGSSNETTA